MSMGKFLRSIGQDKMRVNLSRNKKEVISAYWHSALHWGPSSHPSASIWLLPFDLNSPGHSPGAPDTVEYIPILEDAQQLVVCGHLMEVGTFLIGKE